MLGIKILGSNVETPNDRTYPYYVYSRSQWPKVNIISIVIATLVGAVTLSSCSHASPIGEPTKTEQGLALAYAGCVVGEMDDTKNYSLVNQYWFRYESIFGGVDNFEASQGVIWKTKAGQNLTAQSIQWSDYALEAFATATTLDSRWSNLASLLKSAIDAGIKYWSRTHDDFRTVDAYRVQASQLSGICKVVNVQVFAFAKLKKVSPHSWTKSIAGQYLPYSAP